MSDSTILLIDDDLLSLRMSKLTLTDRGYRVLVASDGVEGLECACRDAPDAILLDLRMPGMDGWEVIVRLRAAPVTAPIPVAAYTSEHLGPSERQRMQAVGFDGCIPKSIPVAGLGHEVQRLILRGRTRA